MDTKLFEDYQKQFSEWQKKFVDTWLESLPNSKSSVDFSENYDKFLKFQEELVSTYLDAQEKTSKMFMETQKQFWKDYFEMMRKQPAPLAG